MSDVLGGAWVVPWLPVENRSGSDSAGHSVASPQPFASR
jgi:hypothetical protein